MQDFRELVLVFQAVCQSLESKCNVDPENIFISLDRVSHHIAKETVLRWQNKCGKETQNILFKKQVNDVLRKSWRDIK